MDPGRRLDGVAHADDADRVALRRDVEARVRGALLAGGAPLAADPRGVALIQVAQLDAPAP